MPNDENSYLFLEYLIATKQFNPNNYNKILELGKAVPESMSVLLRDYSQYLLSRDVRYIELDQYGIDGANGYMEANKIVIPKSLKNDARFLRDQQKRLFSLHGYNQPTINDFDLIICEGLNANLIETLELEQDKIYGVCLDLVNEKNDDKKIVQKRIQKLTAIKTLLNYMNITSGHKYVLSHDKVSSRNKEVYAIRKSK